MELTKGQILSTLIGQRLGTDPKKYEIHGEEVIFYDHALGRTKPSDSPNESPYDTPENRAIVADVVANYDALAVAYLAEQEEIEISDQAKTDLVDIDINSVRSIREWLVTQPGTPQYLLDYEADAIEERKKVK